MADVDDYGYPTDLVETTEQAEAEPEVELRPPDQLEGIQRWLAGDVDLESSGIGDGAAEATLVREVEEMQSTADASLDDQQESAIELPTLAEELRESSTPEGALTDADISGARVAESADRPEEVIQSRQHEETSETPEWEGIREDYDGGMRRRL